MVAKKEVSVGAIVFNRLWKVLLLKRKDKELWEFPKGHVKKNENELQTLKRELREETGITKFYLLSKRPEINKYLNSKGYQRIIKLFPVLTPTSKVALSKEHAKYMWGSLNEIKARLPHENWCRLLDRICANSSISLRKLLNIWDNHYPNLIKNELLIKRKEPTFRGSFPAINIIIPAYNYPKLLKLTLLSLHHQIWKNFEVFVIDDGSHMLNENMLKFLKKLNFKMTYISLKNNKGAAFCRNVGIAFAKAPYLMFLDSDMVLPNDYLLHTVLKIRKCKNAVFVGFFHKACSSKVQKVIRIRFKFAPDYTNDFRYQTKITKDFETFGLNVELRTYKLLTETNFFLNFGNNKRLGVWNLPWMVVSSNFWLKREHAVNVGGFSDKFKEWGFEDTYFGAKLIGYGLYVIPAPVPTALKIIHRDRKGNSLSMKKRIMKTNFRLYKKLLKQPHNFFLLREKFLSEFNPKKLLQNIDLIFKND